MQSIKTPRLILKPWKETDIEPLLQIHQDPRVLEFLIGPMSSDQIRDFIQNQNQQFQEKGFMIWAATLQETQKLIGFIGLNYFDKPTHFSPTVDIGWRLGSPYWGLGYATEGALAVLDYGFKIIDLNEIVAFTFPNNHRSRRVMENIGMVHDVNGSFAHPQLPIEHHLSKQVLYRIKNS